MSLPLVELFGYEKGAGLYVLFPAKGLKDFLSKNKELSETIPSLFCHPIQYFDSRGNLTHAQFYVSDKEIRPLRQALAPYYEVRLTS